MNRNFYENWDVSEISLDDELILPMFILLLESDSFSKKHKELILQYRYTTLDPEMAFVDLNGQEISEIDNPPKTSYSMSFEPDPFVKNFDKALKFVKNTLANGKNSSEKLEIIKKALNDIDENGDFSLFLENYDNQNNRYLLWSLIYLSVKNTGYTDNVKKITHLLFSQINIDKSDFLEMEEIGNSISKIENEIKSIKSSTEPFAIAFKKINELETKIDDFILEAHKIIMKVD